MRLEHPDARPEGVVEPVTARFDPEQHPDDGEIEKENDMRHLARGKRDGDNGGAAGDGPIGRHVEPLSPNHDSAHLAPIKVRHRVDVTRIVETALQRHRRLFARPAWYLFSCHRCHINWITGFARIIQ